ncbi:MAG TPA: phosphoribosylformylglycinamidine synthase subunit PurQ [Oculatellaceae cyanobacterium]
MTAPKALVVCGDGINCEVETSHALSLVGFDVQSIHVTELLGNPQKLQEAKLFCVPGGFSFGDEIASGKVLALKMRQHMRDHLQKFIENKRLVIGICNGFQVLVQLGLLPFPEIDAPRVVSLTHNRQRKFLNRWVTLQVNKSPSADVFFNSLEMLDLPMRHGEGNLKLEVTSGEADPKRQNELQNYLTAVKEHASLRYAEDVNGSLDRIAALSSKDGTVMGLMPHPEAFVRFSQHPRWTNRDWHEKASANGGKPAGLVIFENAFAYVNSATN